MPLAGPARSKLRLCISHRWYHSRCTTPTSACPPCSSEPAPLFSLTRVSQRPHYARRQEACPCRPAGPGRAAGGGAPAEGQQFAGPAGRTDPWVQRGARWQRRLPPCTRQHAAPPPAACCRCQQRPAAACRCEAQPPPPALHCPQATPVLHSLRIFFIDAFDRGDLSVKPPSPDSEEGQSAEAVFSAWLHRQYCAYQASLLRLLGHSEADARTQVGAWQYQQHSQRCRADASTPAALAAASSRRTALLTPTKPSPAHRCLPSWR